MSDDPIGVMRTIRRLIESLPRPPDELGFAGETEQLIASLYLKLGDETAAGDWWVRAALEAEKYSQVPEGKTVLEIAAEKLPNHLGVRRELKRLIALIEAAEGKR